MGKVRFHPKVRVCDPEKHDFSKGACTECGCTQYELLRLGANFINMAPPHEIECDEPGGEHVFVEIERLERMYSDEEDQYLWCKYCMKKGTKR